MEAKRQRVSDLLDAGVKSKEIEEIVGCSRSLVDTVKKLKKENASFSRPKHGGQNKIRTQDFIDNVKAAIEANPMKSKRQLAKELSVDEKTIRNTVQDLGAFSYKRRKQQLLSATTMATRVVKGKRLLSWFKSQPRPKPLIFSDKKFWVVDQAFNHQNDRYIAWSINDVPGVNRTKHPAGIMMLGCVASNGLKMPPYWFEVGLKINAKVYLNVLKTVVKPWLVANFPMGYVMQQDSAPAHKAIIVQKWCQEEFDEFWPWSMWPPSSPDLNPLDYAIWGKLEATACRTAHPSTTALKISVEEAWANLSADFVIKSCAAFRRRVQAMVDANGSHFEQK